MAAPKEEKPVLVAFTLDFETGGLKCQTSACTQIAIHATRLDTFERLGSYVRYIRPYTQKEMKGITSKKKVLRSKYDVEEVKMMEYEPKALEYSAITMDMLEGIGEDIVEVANGAIKFIEEHTPKKAPKNMKPFLLGQNVDFDEGFFMQMMEYAGLVKEVSKHLRGHEDLYGHWHPLTLDTILLGQLALCHLPNVNSYKLELMCEYLGVELDDAHDADADVSATTNVAAVLTQRMRNVGGVSDGVSVVIGKTEKSRKHFKI
jgi:DNA polymerase III epsilon subunit-like protein